MKITQSSTNPFRNSDSNKRYYTYDYYLRRTFGGKCVKIAVDAGFTCPNIDGTCAVGGCIYCSGRGSGDFAAPSTLSLEEQFASGLSLMSKKWDASRRIVYFQAHTNTYAPVEVLREKFYTALSFENVVGLNIATRADCLPEDVLDLLSELSEKTILTVELGLQSSNDESARRINRGHDFETFKRGFEALRSANEKINICTHLIFGLPEEICDDMLQSVRDVAALGTDQVKLHMMYVIDGTTLGEMYKRGEYTPIDRDTYISVACDALELLPTDTVVARITGDGAEDSLLAPLWSRKKTAVINDIDKEMFRRNSYQGRLFMR